jgi:hypothetical protein
MQLRIEGSSFVWHSHGDKRTDVEQCEFHFVLYRTETNRERDLSSSFNDRRYNTGGRGSSFVTASALGTDLAVSRYFICQHWREFECPQQDSPITSKASLGLPLLTI